jgi:hypothetical protein
MRVWRGWVSTKSFDKVISGQYDSFIVFRPNREQCGDTSVEVREIGDEKPMTREFALSWIKQHGFNADVSFFRRIAAALEREPDGA